jgi:hypothetical protein
VVVYRTNSDRTFRYAGRSFAKERRVNPIRIPEGSPKKCPGLVRIPWERAARARGSVSGTPG